MSIIMYACPKCKKVFKVNGSGKKAKCTQCGDVYLAELGIAFEYWEGKSADERKKILARFFGDQPVSQKNQNIAEDDSITNKLIKSTETQPQKKDSLNPLTSSDEVRVDFQERKGIEITATTSSSSDFLDKESNFVENAPQEPEANRNNIVTPQSIPQQHSFFDDWPSKGEQKEQAHKAENNSSGQQNEENKINTGIKICLNCGNQLNQSFKICPYCGKKVKGKKNKKLLISIIIVLCFLILGGAGIGGYFYIQNQAEIKKYKEEAAVVDNKIQDFLRNSSNPLDIYVVKQEYDNLPDEVKQYVTSADELANYKIEITEDNFNDFFEIKLDYSGMNIQTKPGLITVEYDATCNQNTIIQPRGTFRCHDVYVSIDYGVSEVLWEGCTVNHLRLNENGTANDVKEVKCVGYVMVKPEMPIYVKGRYTLSGISGYVTFD